MQCLLGLENFAWVGSDGKIARIGVPSGSTTLSCRDLVAIPTSTHYVAMGLRSTSLGLR